MTIGLPGFRRAAWVATVCAALALGHSAHAATINVTTTGDELGSGSGCSLREAVQSANANTDFGGCAHSGTYGTDLIQLPSGFYTLSRGNFGSFADIDEDGNAVIDIDISGNLTIHGNAANPPSIGNTSGDYRGRIIHVISGDVTLESVVLRDGENPSGRFGAGLRTNPGTTVTLNAVRVFGNTADGGGGGILNEGTMTLNDCLVDNNKTTNAFKGGGGIYNASTGDITLNDSRVLANRTEGNGANGNGAGIFNDSGAGNLLKLDNTTVDGNVIAVGGVVGSNVEGDGGGIYSLGPLSIVQSTISHNVAAGNDASGGGIVCAVGIQATLLIDRTLIFANQARANPDVSSDDTRAGGMLVNCRLILRDSIVSGNVSDQGSGGGLYVETPSLRIERSVIVGNHSRGNGGGVIAHASGLEIVNSTLLGNSSDDNGGGIFAFAINNETNVVDVSSSTIADNTSNADSNIGGGNGGGVSAQADIVSIRNTVLAGNVALGSGVGDDCAGILIGRGHNLIQDFGGCVLSMSNSTDFLGVDARLAAATNNGGPVAGASNGAIAGMPTRAPLPTSPLVDGSSATSCRDGAGDILATDQVGNGRFADRDGNGVTECDIGAIELESVSVDVFADGFE